MPLHKIPSEELRLACRQKLETCELWLRRLIHDELLMRYGSTYFEQGKQNNNHLFRTEIRKHAIEMMRRNSGRYGREVDTLLLEHVIDTICKHDLYQSCFSAALRHAYPDGEIEARTFLSRLVPLRNALSHANPIAVYHAERVLCYCDDVIESLKQYYKDKNMNQEYNAPVFTRFSDSFGHSEIPTKTDPSYYDYSREISMRPGDSVRLEVAIDSSFDPTNYTIEWAACNISNGETGTGSSFVVNITNRHVGESFVIQAILKTGRDWHRHGNFDARMVIIYKVLPPVA